MEDTLKKLDKLTQEEARMAVAENLKATHSVDDRVRGVANTVVAIDNRVAGVDDRLAGVDVRVAGVDVRVAGVDVRVAGVDDRIKQTANDVDQVKRPSSNFIGTDMDSYASFQKTNCGRTSINGSPHRIRRLIITSRVVLTTRKQRPGSFKAPSSENGNHQARSFGSTGNVRRLLFLIGSPLLIC